MEIIENCRGCKKPWRLIGAKYPAEGVKIDSCPHCQEHSNPEALGLTVPVQAVE